MTAHNSIIEYWSIDSITIGERHRKDMGDIAGLAANINTIGLLHPVVVTQNESGGLDLIAGARRIAAYKLLGRDTIPMRVVSIDAIVLGEMAENELRKDFTVSERVAIGKAVEAYVGERRGRDNPQNIAELKGTETRQIAAEKAGFGNAETYRQAKTITTKGADELIEAVNSEAISISAAANIANIPIDQQRDIIAALPRDAEGKLTPGVKKVLAQIVQGIRSEKAAASEVGVKRRPRVNRRLEGYGNGTRGILSYCEGLTEIDIHDITAAQAHTNYEELAASEAHISKEKQRLKAVVPTVGTSSPPGDADYPELPAGLKRVLQ